MLPVTGRPAVPARARLFLLRSDDGAAFVIARVSLGLNGSAFDPPEEEAVVMVEGLAAGEVTQELFADWLERHFPDRRDKVLNRIRSMRGGKLNEGRFVERMKGEGPFAEHIRTVFRTTCRRLGLNAIDRTLSTAAFRRPDPTGQLALFES